MTTYGVEAEFQVNASAVIRGLHERGLAGVSTLHGYHCDCDYCAWNNGYPFRGQTDSSCSGEIITDILGGGDDERHCNYNVADLFQALSDVAVEVDAEPGLTSGVHVHVSVAGRSAGTLQDAMWQFVRWETVLQRVAGGRWPDQRHNVNRTVRECLAATFYNYARGLGNGMSRITNRNIAAAESSFSAERLHNMKNDMWTQQCCTDRHSNLNCSARHTPTWEFRLWNSTRVAWRYQLFADLSKALLDHTVVTALSGLEPPLRRNNPSAGFDSLALAVSEGNYPGLAELIERQGHYLDNRASTASSILTAL